MSYVANGRDLIPGGMTSLIQPPDVSLNKSFKDRTRKLCNDWMVSDDIQLIKSGN